MLKKKEGTAYTIEFLVILSLAFTYGHISIELSELFCVIAMQIFYEMRFNHKGH